MQKFSIPKIGWVNNLVIRFLLELILLASLGVWGYHFAGGTFSRIVLTAGLPLTAAIIWGLFISPKARISLPIAAVVFIEFSLVGTAAYGLKRKELSQICSSSYDRHLLILNRLIYPPIERDFIIIDELCQRKAL